MCLRAQVKYVVKNMVVEKYVRERSCFPWQTTILVRFRPFPAWCWRLSFFHFTVNCLLVLRPQLGKDEQEIPHYIQSLLLHYVPKLFAQRTPMSKISAASWIRLHVWVLPWPRKCGSEWVHARVSSLVSLCRNLDLPVTAISHSACYLSRLLSPSVCATSLNLCMLSFVFDFPIACTGWKSTRARDLARQQQVRNMSWLLQ